MSSFDYARRLWSLVRSTQYLVLGRRCAVVAARMIAVFACFFGAPAVGADTNPGLKLATFDVDATPPVSSMMAYDKVLRQDDLSLRCRGVALLGAGQPIVLCALDWIG